MTKTIQKFLKKCYNIIKGVRQMIKHILFWKFKEESKNNDFDNKILIMQQKFGEMPCKIEGLITAEIGKDISGGLYDVVLYTEFTDITALERYKIHPLHIEIKEIIKDWIENKIIIDYEI
jgi:hypothetical protein